MIQRLSIQQFRGFYTKQTFNFAIPDNHKTGSGLTVIVGPNNTGKTTFIEALTYHNNQDNNKRFNDSERHGRPPVITIIDDQRNIEKITNVNRGSQVGYLDDGRASGFEMELIASRRHWEAQYSGQLEHSQFINTSNKNARKVGDPGTAQLIATLNTQPQIRDELTNLMKRLVPHFSFWTVGTREPAGDYIKYETARRVEHAVDMLGDGIISLFRICAHLVNPGRSNYTLVIDEPELSLHPTAQKELHLILSEYAKEKQIIIVTHSPHFVDWNDLNKGAKLIRLNKHEDIMSTVHELQSTAAYSSMISGAVDNWQQPEVLDTVAKEIMFADKILFVEGKEDVGLIRRWLRKNDKTIHFEIFGYGVGGETRMPLFLKFAEDLGVYKVGVLFDRNAQSYNLCKRTYPNYLIRRLSTDDIRDKFDGATQTKVGIFDHSGIIKPSSQNELKTHIDKYEMYFNA